MNQHLVLSVPAISAVGESTLVSSTTRGAGGTGADQPTTATRAGANAGLMAATDPAAGVCASTGCARSGGARVVTNAPPAATLSSRLREPSDLLAVNMHEARELTATRDVDALRQVQNLLLEQVPTATVTLGAQRSHCAAPAGQRADVAAPTSAPTTSPSLGTVPAPTSPLTCRFRRRYASRPRRSCPATWRAQFDPVAGYERCARTGRKG